MPDIPDISIGEVAFRLVVAAALTGLVGLEREWRERAAGLRTHMLVGVGSALFTLVSAYGFNEFLVGSIRLEFDQELFRWLISWQPYGGAHAQPLAGSYALGVEPWTSRLPLGEAVAAGEACRLASGDRLRTTVVARVTTGDEWHQ